MTLDVAIAVLLKFYTHETETEFGVEQRPKSTPEMVDQAWWTLATHDREFEKGSCNWE